MTDYKDKWCPFVRFVSDSTDGSDFNNRYQETETVRYPANCIGPDCMAWRWIATQGPWDDPKPLKKNGGYCGLAGKQ